MTDLIEFLLMATGISLSGVMAPGPVTAATLVAGTRSKHAGSLIALGHGIIEFPLMLLIMGGMSTLFKSQAIKIGIGLVGGIFLLHMGIQILRSINKGSDSIEKYADKSPVWIGIILSGGNPYFLLWWATIGLALSSRAIELGVLAFGLFAVVHWLCDLVWLEALSLAGFKGSKLLGQRSRRIVLVICSLALLVFGVMFICDAGKGLLTRPVNPEPHQAIHQYDPHLSAWNRTLSEVG
ncbi:MAG: LysE family transporter [Planctomycetota bacterium]|nr:MAG: LysE family transporter [Planctomycetota bacterium]